MLDAPETAGAACAVKVDVRDVPYTQLNGKILIKENICRKCGVYYHT